MANSFNYYVKVNGGFVFRIHKGNYYTAPLNQQSFCGMTKARATRYKNRLDSMGVECVIIQEETK